MIQRFAIPGLLFVGLLTWSQVSSGAILARTDMTIPVGTGGPAYADNITFDSATNLEWLDFTWTLGQPYNAIVGSGTASAVELYPGFRYATQAQVLQL